MPEQVVVDSLAFARGSKALRGKIPVAELPRLRDYLYSTAGVIEYELRGTVNFRGKPQLHLSIQGRICLKCQRCLGELVHYVDRVGNLLLIENKNDFPEITEENEAVDCIPAEIALDVLALIEEEIILGLPLSPRHDAAACRISEEFDGSRTVRTAFASLATLKNRNSR
ncbi:MAG: YceD family protein [Burkholderiales bacterium]